MTQSSLSISTLHHMLHSTLDALTLDPKRDVEDLKAEREAATAELAVLQPRDAIEAAFASRIVTAHHAAMECFRRSAQPGVPDVVAMRLVSHAMALSRLSAQLLRTLEQRQQRAGDAHASAPANPLQAAAAPAGAQHPLPGERPAAAPAARTAVQQPTPAPRPVAADRSTQAVPVGPVMTREELAALSGLPIHMIPAV